MKEIKRMFYFLSGAVSDIYSAVRGNTVLNTRNTYISTQGRTNCMELWDIPLIFLIECN
jgi:hypothetical protein